MSTRPSAKLGMRLLLAFLRLSSRFPYRIQMSMGSIAGRLIRRHAHRRRSIVAKNLELCFPKLSAAEREQLLHDHFASLGRALFETGLAYWAGEDRLRRLLKIDGVERLRNALAEGHGVILVAAHFTPMELGGRLLGMVVDYDAVIRPFSNPQIDAIVRAGRRRAVNQMIPKKSFRQFLHGLRKNRTLLITVDQATTARNKVMAPFFGVPAPTSVNAARIAQKTGAIVLPLLWVREPDLSGYRVEIGARLANFPTGDAWRDACSINSLVEQQILEAPEQYYWIHRRFKRDPSPYDA